MLQFRDINLDDMTWVTPLLEASGYLGNDYTFPNIFNWRCAYNSKIVRINDYLVVKLHLPDPVYLFPAGHGDLSPVIDLMISDAAERDIPFKMIGIEAAAKSRLEQLFPNRFLLQPMRDYFDYLYTREKLATLPGKKLHSKRTNLRHFLNEAPSWVYEPITPDNIQECIEMHTEWRRQNLCFDDPDSTCDGSGLVQEKCAVKNAFAHFFELGMEGGLLRVDGRVVAFAAGERYRTNHFIVNIEKAFLSPAGSYAMINNQVASHLPEDILYINREDDVGDPGLRKAKLSYKPDLLLEKFEATLV